MSEFRFEGEAAPETPPATAPPVPPKPEAPAAPVAPAPPVAPAASGSSSFAFSLDEAPEAAPFAPPAPKPMPPKPAPPANAVPTAPAASPTAPPAAPAAPKATPAAAPELLVPALDYDTLSAPPAAKPATPPPAAPRAAAPPTVSPAPNAPRPAPPAPAPQAGVAPLRPAAPATPRPPQAPGAAPAQGATPSTTTPQGVRPAAPPKPAAPGSAVRPAGPPKPAAPQPPGPPRPQAPTPPLAPGAPRAAQAPAAPQAPTPPTDPNAAARNVAAYAAVNAGAGSSRMDGMMSGLNSFVEKALPIAEWAMKIGGVLALLSLIFLALKLFGGKTTPMALGTPLWSNINLAASLFGPLAIVAALGAIFVIWEQKGSGIAVSILGLALFMGLPIVLGKQFHPGNGSVTGYAAAQLIAGCRTAGFGITAIGLLKWLVEMVVWLVEMPERMKQKADIGQGQNLDAKQQRVARDANMFSPCWSLPFCREVIRKQCPAYLARKRCWKFKRGCYCDDEMIARIIRGDSLEKILAPTKMSMLRKPPCKRCYIYLDHQTHKFKVMSPLAVPLTILFMFAIWNPFTTAFDPAYRKMDAWQKNLHIFSAPDPFQANQQTKEEAQKIGEVPIEQVISYSQTMVGMLIGFFALIYISKGIEWAVFEAKL